MQQNDSLADGQASPACLPRVARVAVAQPGLTIVLNHTGANRQCRCCRSAAAPSSQFSERFNGDAEMQREFQQFNSIGMS